ncbi:hypothetical protein BDV37DRAFT_270127 [Aspergillus pseudonomiae]|uniref:CRAL-TRIO domain-containing protein n=1 Tax=Aspergillus pseudonomiae TaxID=1506151 RepID=A0A5N7DIQ9_9EURO|nr:uncharacterized protein BDV37DRAFT_270127 [Aspergillus pseudonomiae]KAE8406224.1 hypothetical protein BDV37DRAFT_270127 [Aspergillus pseudonomiae]
MDLTKEETKDFATFHRLCMENGLLERPRDLRTADVQDGVNDEVTLLRFFKAGCQNSHRALQQLQEATKFREEQHILPLYTTIHVDDFEDTRKLVISPLTGRRDKCGLPILVWTMLFHDTLARSVLPRRSAMSGRPSPLTPVSNAIYLVDASVQVRWILMTCYPEIIERIFESQPARKWVDPGTAAKVVVLKKSAVYTTLEKSIDKENIPTKFGGGFAAPNRMSPDLDHGIHQRLH